MQIEISGHEISGEYTGEVSRTGLAIWQCHICGVASSHPHSHPTIEQAAKEMAEIDAYGLER